MSIANLFNPNQAILYCGSITPTQTGYVTLDGIETLTNKTLTTPVISSVINSGNTITFPTVTADLIGRATLDTISNKSLYDDFNNIVQFSDETIKIGFKCGGLTNTKTTLLSSQNSNITLTLPNVTGTLALVSQIPNLANYVDTTTNQTIGGIKTFSSSTVKLVNSKLSIITWTQVTTTNFSIDVLTVPVPVNSAITIETNLTFYVTAGTDINKSGIRRRTHRASNVGGGVSAGAQLENLTNNDPGLNAVAVQYVASGNNVIVQIIGIIGDTILATGVTQVFYI
jgi:hypothetical protein